MTKVSIIVPCYNVEQYVSKCLDSLINQTLADIEIICIDDKSTDSTLKILKKYAAQDKRVKLFCQTKNHGVAIARNIGLEHAVGKYIGFVDPDDWVDLDFYEKLYNKALELNVDIVQASVMVTNATNNTTHIGRFNYPKNSLSHFASAFWSAIYKKDMLVKHNIHFPPNILTAEDSVFLTQVSICAKGITFVQDTCYHYLYQRNGSLDSKYLSHAKAVSTLDALRLKLQYICSANMSQSDFCKYLKYHVIKPALYALRKSYERLDDHYQMFNFLVQLRTQYGIETYFDSVVPCRYRKAFKTNDFNKFIDVFSTIRGHVYLFGFIPILKIEKSISDIKITLFDILPLIKIHNKKVYLFSFVPILKIKR